MQRSIVFYFCYNKTMNKPFIIAEMSGNHNKSLERALKIVEAAAGCGVDALKLQTYTADSITINCRNEEFLISEEGNLWKGENLYDLYIKASTPYEWHKPIFDKCQELGLTCFSTPFDLTAVDFLEELNCPIYKIASYENADFPLLKRVAQTKKPIIMSLGMLSLEGIKESVKALKDNGCTDLTLLKCTSEYPAKFEDLNLLTIPDLKKHFPDCKIGLSDHTTGIGASIAAVALGAEVIEKHFTISRDDGGVDSAFSMEPAEMKQLIEECNNVYKGLGKISYELSEKEQEGLKYKRSLYVVKDIKKGEKFTPENIRSIRPSLGLDTRHYEEILGKTALQDLSFGTPLKLEDIFF